VNTLIEIALNTEKYKPEYWDQLGLQWQHTIACVDIWIFRKVEPYLIFLNPVNLDRKCPDVQSKVDKLETINQRLQGR